MAETLWEFSDGSTVLRLQRLVLGEPGLHVAPARVAPNSPVGRGVILTPEAAHELAALLRDWPPDA